MSDILQKLEKIILAHKHKDAGLSYVAALHAKGLDRIVQKVGEEAIETIIAAKNAHTDRQAFIREMADLWFHNLVLLSALDLSVADITKELQGRLGISGIKDKSAG